VHVAETDEQALADVRVGERLETVTYFEDALGRPPARSQDPLTDGVKAGTTLVGSPETVKRGLQAFAARTGADEIMVTAQIFDHAARLRSFELTAEAWAALQAEPALVP